MTGNLSRRNFVRLLPAAATALSLPGPVDAVASVQANMPPNAGPVAADQWRFPEDFLWGSATASYQVEGAVHEEGRGPSIWDTFSHTPGKVANGDTGDVADDFFHRYKQDIILMKQLGLQSFRFSVAWPRVFPSGTGGPNPIGLDFYQRLCDALLEAGIQPFCTLFHWDMPQALQDKGGWESRDTAKAFADYAAYTAGKLSDKIQHFMTMNEMRTVVDQGHVLGVHAPGLRLSRARVAQLNHHMVLAHGMGVQAIRAQAKAGTKVGIAENPLLPVPALDSPSYIAAATKALREENASYLTVLQEGAYPDLYLQRLGADAPKYPADDLRIIGSPMDFVGLNCYEATYVRPAEDAAGYALIPRPASYPHMLSSWLAFAPEGLYWLPKLAHHLWGIREIYITENGTSSSDEIAPDGNIYDTDRVMFLRSYLTQLKRTVESGTPVKGYFLWSLLDNFEWADGYSRRFGIVYVNFKAQERIPKLSSQFYREVIRRRQIV